MCFSELLLVLLAREKSIILYWSLHQQLWNSDQLKQSLILVWSIHARWASVYSLSNWGNGRVARLKVHIRNIRSSDQDSSIRLRLRNLFHVTVFVLEMYGIRSAMFFSWNWCTRFCRTHKSKALISFDSLQSSDMDTDSDSFPFPFPFPISKAVWRSLKLFLILSTKMKVRSKFWVQK